MAVTPIGRLIRELAQERVTLFPKLYNLRMTIAIGRDGGASFDLSE